MSTNILSSSWLGYGSQSGNSNVAKFSLSSQFNHGKTSSPWEERSSSGLDQGWTSCSSFPTQADPIKQVTEVGPHVCFSDQVNCRVACGVKREEYVTTDLGYFAWYGVVEWSGVKQQRE